MKSKLNLGCGTDIKEDYINLDFIKGKGVDIVHDLNKIPYPFKDDTFDYILASHILEHLKQSMKEIIKELVRISKNNAVIEVRVPHYTSMGCYSEHHVRFFKLTSFSPSGTSLERKSDYNSINKEKTKILFDKKLPFNYLVELLVNLIPKAYEHTFLKYLFPAAEYRFMLRVTK